MVNSHSHGPDPTDPAVIDVHDFRSAGSMKRISRTVPAAPDLGNAVITVPEHSPIEVDLLLESVIEGVLVSGTARMSATGDCSRCLEPVILPAEFDFSELFAWQEPPPEEISDTDEPLPLIQSGLIDLSPLLRDAIVLGLPLAPVCEESCPGLCVECGIKLADDPGHRHEVTDPRWAALGNLDLPADDGPT